MDNNNSERAGLGLAPDVTAQRFAVQSEAAEIPAAENALLFLWGVNSMTPEAIEVIEAWGFEYLTKPLPQPRAVRT